MKLSKIKEHLANTTAVNFKLPDGSTIPSHFHVTEVGLVSKHFIDCGGTERKETVANFRYGKPAIMIIGSPLRNSFIS